MEGRAPASPQRRNIFSVRRRRAPPSIGLIVHLGLQFIRVKVGASRWRGEAPASPQRRKIFSVRRRRAPPSNRSSRVKVGASQWRGELPRARSDVTSSAVGVAELRPSKGLVVHLGLPCIRVKVGASRWRGELPRARSDVTSSAVGVAELRPPTVHQLRFELHNGGASAREPAAT